MELGGAINYVCTADHPNRVHAQSRICAPGSLGCLKALQRACCVHSFAQRHQLRRVSENREEHPQLDELRLRNLDLEEVARSLLNLAAAAGRVRASGTQGTGKRAGGASACWRIIRNPGVQE